MVAACLVPVMIAEALALGLGAPLPVVAVAAMVTGLALGVYAVIFQTMMQTAVPAAVLARVSAFDLLGSELAQPAGYALAGPAGAAVGPHGFLAAGAAVVFLGAAAMTLPRSLRDRALAYGSRSQTAESVSVSQDREPEGGGLP